MNFSMSSDIIAELFDVAINVILHARGVYPPQAFVRKRKYNTSVMVSAYPSLTSYIDSCVTAVKEILQKDEIHKLFVVILSPQNTVVEKFVFDITQRSLTTKQIENEVNLKVLQEALKVFCLKLSTSQSLLTPLPEGCTFSIQIEVPSSSKVEEKEDYPWIEPEKQETEVPNSKIIPLRKVRSEVCNVHAYIEQSNVKSK